jgi:hypothetical protein
MVTAQVLGKRPGGLTALAVVSFVIAGIAMLMSVFILLAMQMVGSVAQGFGAEHAHAAMAPMYAMFGLAAVASVLLLVAGVGYLKQKRFGWLCGNAYSVIAIGNTIFAGAVADKASVAMYVLGFGFPVITLALINTVFRKNLA